jgi:hypothetical protein
MSASAAPDVPRFHRTGDPPGSTDQLRLPVAGLSDEGQDLVGEGRSFLEAVRAPDCEPPGAKGSRERDEIAEAASHLHRLAAERLLQLRLVGEGQFEGEAGKDPGTEGPVSRTQRVERFLEEVHQPPVDHARFDLRVPEAQRGQREPVRVAELAGDGDGGEVARLRLLVIAGSGQGTTQAQEQLAAKGLVRPGEPKCRQGPVILRDGFLVRVGVHRLVTGLASVVQCLSTPPVGATSAK